VDLEVQPLAADELVDSTAAVGLPRGCPMNTAAVTTPGPAEWALIRRPRRGAPWEVQSQHATANGALRAMLAASANRDRDDDPRDFVVRKLTPDELAELDRPAAAAEAGRRGSGGRGRSRRGRG
jgi:hypothetical protein